MAEFQATGRRRGGIGARVKKQPGKDLLVMGSGELFADLDAKWPGRRVPADDSPAGAGTGPPIVQ
jgi:hypothetical protein